jgi:hypothetical protein
MRDSLMKIPIGLNLTILIGLIIFLSSTRISIATNYYVDHNHPSASDSNSGMLTSPWKTIQHAAETIVAGDTVFIRDGVYDEQVITDQDGSASSGYIVFSAYLNEKPVIDGSGVSTGTTGFSISHSYIKLMGLEIRNWDTGIWMEMGGYIEINDCEVYHNFYGIGAANGAHDFVLNRVEIHHFDLYGFDASPSDGADCYNGTFNDCIAHTGRDREQNVDGFALGHGTQHDFIFNRCTVYDVFDGFDISSRNTTLNECLAYNCWNGGYKLWQDNVKLINCIGHSCPGSNVELDWDEQPGTTHLINCTFFNSGTFNVWIENPGDHLRMYNCILAGGDNIGLAFEQIGVSNYEGDYNLFHNDNPNRAIAVAYTDEFTLDQVKNGSWTTYSGQDAHSLVEYSDANLFIDPVNLDLHLIETSLAVDHASSDFAPPIDIEGKVRPNGNGFDIGAYEYGSPVSVKYNQATFSASNSFLLFRSYPNPFNSNMVISYQLNKNTTAEIEIFNIYGQVIQRWQKIHPTTGEFKITWDARDNSGKSLPSGEYLCRMKSGNNYQTIKLIYLK